MKRESNIGDSQRISIYENGIVSIPSETKMSIVEIADLFEISYQIIKRNIRAIEKTNIATGDYTMSCSLEGQTIYPDYYGLDMIVALAFRVQSAKVEILRQWIVRKLLRPEISELLITNIPNSILN